jgi:hypothetical protein
MTMARACCPPRRGFVKAREAAKKAARDRSGLFTGPRAAREGSRLSDNDLAGAAQHYKRALALDPADLDVLRNSAALLSLSAAWTRRWRSTRPSCAAIR